MPFHVGDRPGNLASPCHILSILLFSISYYVNSDRLCAHLPLYTCATIERRFVTLALGLRIRIVASHIGRYRKIEWRRASRRSGAQRHVLTVSTRAGGGGNRQFGNWHSGIKISNSKLGPSPIFMRLIIRTVIAKPLQDYCILRRDALLGWSPCSLWLPSREFSDVIIFEVCTTPILTLYLSSMLAFDQLLTSSSIFAIRTI
jgi:hypothetical protein